MPKPTSIPTEHAEQAVFVQWFRSTYPGVRIAAIPNGGFRTKSEAEKLRLEGVSAGFPDLIIPEWFAVIEMKRSKGGRVDPEQRDWLSYLSECGYRTAVCKGALEAMAFCEEISKNPLRLA